MLPAAISRKATTVGLSFSQFSVGSAPLASRRARCEASSTSWKRLSTLCRQSSTVIRAIAARKAWEKGPPLMGRKRGETIRDRRESGQHRALSQQILQQRGEPWPGGEQQVAIAFDDGRQLGGGTVEVVVHDHVVKLVPVRHIADRITQATGDDLVRVGVAIPQARLERLPRGRQDEDGARFR